MMPRMFRPPIHYKHRFTEENPETVQFFVFQTKTTGSKLPKPTAKLLNTEIL